MKDSYVIIDIRNQEVYHKHTGTFGKTLTSGCLYKGIRRSRRSGLTPSYACEARHEALHHSHQNREIEIHILSKVEQDIRTARHWGNPHVDMQVSL